MHMKKFFGLCILVILLVAISGCTQQTQTTPATTVATTIAAMEPTAVPTTEITTLPVATVETTPAATNVTTNVTAEGPTTLSTPRAALTPQTKITTVSMTNNTFTPKILTILPGTGITWKNDDTVIHVVKVTGKHAGMFNSGDIIPGSTWSYTFNQDVDTYDIVDPNFPQMNSTIVVKEGQSFSGVI
jgi:plastocyanin